MCGVGTHDPCTRLISVFVVLGFLLFILHVVLCEFITAEAFQKEAEAWDDAEWSHSRCSVLSAGVSCINTKDSEDEKHWSLCSQNNNRSGSALPNLSESNPPVFSVWQRSICPGSYFCAKEREPCSCIGQITYGRVLFDGYHYHTPQNSSYTFPANGSQHLCGVDQHGQILADPSPKHRKFCWCTPKEILDILHDKSNKQPLERQRCADSADTEFTGSRRLKSDSSRRRTYQYTPWALVIEAKTKKISCAYEYGVPRPSTDLYETAGARDVDGYGSEDHIKANFVAQSWGAASKGRDCWIHNERKSGICSIALKPPDTLTGRADKLALTAKHHLILCILMFLSLCLLGCGVIVAAREMNATHQRRTFSPLLGESTSVSESRWEDRAWWETPRSRFSEIYQVEVSCGQKAPD